MWRAFRDVTFPQLRTALVAGALLAFALSFDEIIVTTFTAGSQETLPIWIFSNYSRPNQLPIVNVVGLSVIVLSIIPVYLANRLSQDPIGAPGGAGGREPPRRLVVLLGVGRAVDDDFAALRLRQPTPDQDSLDLGLEVVAENSRGLDRPAVPVGNHVNVAHRVLGTHHFPKPKPPAPPQGRRKELPLIRRKPRP